MNNSRIRALCDEYSEMGVFFDENDQPSFRISIDDIYKKALLLAAASYFEYEIYEVIKRFARTASCDNTRIVNLIDNKVLSRQYHTFFDWDNQQTNKFLSMFGDDFKKEVRERIKKEDLQDAEAAFMYIGRERNKLVHGNYAEASITSTFDEIKDKYSAACLYVELIESMLQ